MKKIYSKILKCRICNDKNLVNICKFENIKLTGIFPKDKKKYIDETPLEVVFSKKSKLLQLNHNYNLPKLFGNHYGYRSGLNSSMVKHLKKKFLSLSKNFKIKPKDKILDIGSNDGTFLNFFPKKSIRVGCDPTAKKFKKYYDKSIKVLPKIFDKYSSKKISGKYKLISSIAMFYDLSNPIEFCNLVEKKLEKNGIFHVEIAYLPFILKTYSFDTFCQEHLTYFSLKSFENLIKQTGLKILDYQTNSINGGSISFNLALKISDHKVNKKKLSRLRKYEIKNNVNSLKYLIKFFKKVKKNIKYIESKIKSLQGNVHGFGASTKGNVTLQLCKLTEKDIISIYDINKEKFGSYTPGSNIKIINENKIMSDKPKNLVFFIWHFKKTIADKLKKFNLRKTNYIWLFPKYKVIKSEK
jgi:hypothetical protein